MLQHFHVMLAGHQIIEHNLKLFQFIAVSVLTFIMEARSCSTICLSTGSELVDIERPRVTFSVVSVTLDDLDSFFLAGRGFVAAAALANLGRR